MLDEDGLKKLCDWFRRHGFVVYNRRWQWRHMATNVVVKHKETDKAYIIGRKNGKEFANEIDEEDIVFKVPYNTAMALAESKNNIVTIGVRKFIDEFESLKKKGESCIHSYIDSKVEEKRDKPSDGNPFAHRRIANWWPEGF